jgi:chemotaxis protein methyltransferase CheR
MNPDLLQNFIRLIASHTGMQIQDRDRVELVKKIDMRVTALKLASPTAYYQLLDTIALPGNKTDLELSRAQEWEALTLLLTTGETYFFRDRGQLDLIAETILPEIIARKMQAQAISKVKPMLRIWSAGCSTGEEPYSLATIVQELIPNYLNWNLLILGTDINTESIAKAKAASYSEWSFRMVSGEIKRRYFSNEHKNWQLNDKIRRMVAFRSGNLLTDNYPSINSDIYNMDIIICRNVFIYFNSENVETILSKFYQSLSPGGYLIVGHTELHDLNLQGFVPKAYEESVVYRRSEDMPKEIKTAAATQTRIPTTKPVAQPIAAQPKSRLQKPSSTQPPVSPLPPLPERSPTAKATQPPVEIKPDPKQGVQLAPPSELEKAQALFEQGEYLLALQRADELLRQTPNNFDVIYLIAQAYANLGQYKKAMYYCEQAIALDSMSTDVYHLLAHIAEDQSNLSLAKEYLKRIIYIDENAIAAYLDLGSIYKLEADSRRAKQMFDTAIDLLNKLSSDTKVQYRGKVKVAELLGQIKANM